MQNVRLTSSWVGEMIKIHTHLAAFEHHLYRWCDPVLRTMVWQQLRDDMQAMVNLILQQDKIIADLKKKLEECTPTHE